MAHSTKVLLLVGGPEYHDLPEHREILSDILGSRFETTMTDDLTVLQPEVLDGYDVIANYTTFMEPTEEQCDALLDAVNYQLESSGESIHASCIDCQGSTFLHRSLEKGKGLSQDKKTEIN